VIGAGRAGGSLLFEKEKLMKKCMLILILAAAMAAPSLAEEQAAEKKPGKGPAPETVKKDYWVGQMKKVHAKFTGTPGTFAHFGDSITVTMAFWSSLKWTRKNMDKKTLAAYELVKGHMKDECWNKWKGSKFGNTGQMTIRWAHGNVDKWLKDLKPEVALIMFGTNDLGGLGLEEYDKKTREVVKKCLDNGTIVILSTIPPRSGADAKCKTFVQAVRKISKDMKVPLCDYHQAVVKRRPEDWNGALPKFKDTPGDEYQVPTLVSRDGVHPSNPSKWVGDYSEEGLKHNGYTLRSYVVLHSYAEVIREVLRPEPAKKEPAKKEEVKK
jgi:lysophospholipase L1-like esterase